MLPKLRANVKFKLFSPKSSSTNRTHTIRNPWNRFSKSTVASLISLRFKWNISKYTYRDGGKSVDWFTRIWTVSIVFALCGPLSEGVVGQWERGRRVGLWESDRSAAADSLVPDQGCVQAPFQVHTVTEAFPAACPSVSASGSVALSYPARIEDLWKKTVQNY